MANERYTRTNQKLYFAGLALESCRNAESDQRANTRGLIQAEREAAVFHLYGALLGLCHEIAGYYRLADADALQVEILIDPRQLEAVPGPELAELIELAARPQSWLAQLLVAYQALFLPPKEPKKARIDPGLALIDSVSLSEAQPGPGLEQLESWRQQLKALVIRFREGLTEW